jgi:hypothetical protein
MAGLYVLFMAIMIVGLAVGYAAQYRPLDHERPSDIAAERRTEEDDAA